MVLDWERTKEDVLEYLDRRPTKRQVLIREFVGERITMGRTSFLKLLKELQRSEKVLRDKSTPTAKDVWYFLPKDKELWEDIKKGKSVKKEVEKPKYAICEANRINHTNDIREHVIEVWLKKMPEVEYKRVYLRARVVGLEEEDYNPNIPLDFEEHPLFEDFREHHVSFEPNPFELWEDFKKCTEEFHRSRDELLSKLRDWVAKETKLSYSDNWDKFDIFTKKFLQLLYRHLIHWYDRKGRWIEHEDIVKKVERDATQNIVIYRGLGAEPCIKIKGKGEEDITRSSDKLAKTIQRMLVKIEGGELNIYGQHIIEKINHLEEIRRKIVQVLEKHKYKVPLSGDCEYTLK